MNITDSGSSDKQGLDGLQMGIFGFVDGGDVVQLQVQVLVDGSQGALDFDIIFQFHNYLLINKSFEKTEEQHVRMYSELFVVLLVEVLSRKTVRERLDALTSLVCKLDCLASKQLFPQSIAQAI